jgi:hypothetical protein
MLQRTSSVKYSTAALAAIVAAAGAGLLPNPAPARAADWRFDPKIAVGLEYNDNNRMTSVAGEEIEVTGGSVDAEVSLRAQTPTSSFRLVPRLRSTFYPGDSSEEKDDQFVRMQLDHKGQRNAASLRAEYSRIEVLGDYLPGAAVSPDAELGDPDRGVDISEVDQRNRQDRLAIRPAVSFDLKPRHALEFRANYFDVDYDRVEVGDREGYRSLGGAVAYRFQQSRTASLALQAGAGQYKPDLGGGKTDGYDLGAEWSNRISETSEWFARLAANRVRTKADEPGASTDWESGFSGGAGVRWSFEVTQVFLDVNRYLDPNASGKVVTRDHLRVDLRRRLTPLMSGFVGARYIRDGKAADGSELRGKEYAAANLGLEWRMTRQFALVGRYDYFWQENEGAASDAQANAIRLIVVYEPNRR